MKYAMDRHNVNTVCEELLKHIHSDKGNWFALLDQAFDYGRKAINWNGKKWKIYYQDQWTSLESVSPVLMELDYENEEPLEQQAKRLLRHCNGRPMLSFFQFNGSGEDLRDALQANLSVSTQDGQRFILRFADTRISAALTGGLLPATWQRFALLDKWLIIDRAGQLKSLSSKDKPPPTDDEIKSPWVLSEAEYVSLLQQGMPDSIIDVLYSQFSELVAHQAGSALHQIVCRICATGERHKIDSFPDLVALSVASFATKGTILENPKLDAILSQKNWPAGSLSQHLSELMEPA